MFHTGYGTKPPSYLMVTWQLSTDVKRQEREANLSYQRDANMQKD